MQVVMCGGKVNKYLGGYEHNHSWQYQRKLETLKEDEEFFRARIADYDDFINFSPKQVRMQRIEKDDMRTHKLTKFIERYEWLGKMPVWITDRYAFFRSGVLVGVLIFSTPNAFQNVMGEEYKNKEKLIARGATISFAPKNLGSHMIMSAIKHMVQTTEYRIFSAYADPMALELGTIYQACNFYYLGQNFGGGSSFYKEGKFVGSSYFNQRGTIKRISTNYGVRWYPEYIKSNRTGSKRIIAWEEIPPDVRVDIKQAVAKEKRTWTKITAPKKHKYYYVLGRDKRETSQLRKLFLSKTEVFPYPKNRGE